MHQDNCHRAQTLIVSGLHSPAGTRDIERPQDFSSNIDTLVNLKHVAIEQLGQHNFALEQLRPVLIRNTECVTKATRNDEQRRFTLALKQCIGCDCGPNLDDFDLIRGDRRARGQIQ